MKILFFYLWLDWLLCDALWETVSEVDWSNAYWKICPNQYDIRKLLAYTADFALVCILNITFWPNQYVLPV